MGLDTFAAHTPDDTDLTDEDFLAFQEANISLCGGIGNFRGKIYAEYVLEITGESLYAEWLPPETVKEMYEAFKAYEYVNWHEDEALEPEDIEHINLCRFFKVCTDRGLGLVAWS